MKDLKELLELRNLTEDDANERFQEIAEVLMGNYEIIKGTKSYAIVEIEFYFYSPNHQDFITYPRVTGAGRWFFHQSGVDLSFGSIGVEQKIDRNKKTVYELNGNPCFGGILIRGIYNMANGEYTFGPQKCVDVLWNDFNAFENINGEYPILQKSGDIIPTHLIQCKRYINIPEKDQIKKIHDWVSRLGLNLEDVEKYRKGLFDNPAKYPYRFFNMQHGENPCIASQIPSATRPKENEIKYLS